MRLLAKRVVLSGHALERFEERVGGDADLFAVELSMALAEGRYRPAWRRGGVYVDAGTGGSALVDVSRVPPEAVTVYAESATPRHAREGTAEPSAMSTSRRSDPETANDRCGCARSEHEPDTSEGRSNVRALPGYPDAAPVSDEHPASSGLGA